MAKPAALVSDFDGTISDRDFFWLIVDECLGSDGLAPWRLFEQGKLSHLEALNRIFAQIHLPETQLRQLITKIGIDAYFPQVADFCQKQKIPFYICSAGCDYYIELLIGEAIRRFGIHLVTNRGVYEPRQGLRMIPPQGPFHDDNVGISKAGVVGFLQLQGYAVTLAGDGLPDVAPARIADTVFARTALLAECRREGIATLPFTDFRDIYDYLKEEC